MPTTRKTKSPRPRRYGGGWLTRARRYDVPGWNWHDILVLMGSIEDIRSGMRVRGYYAPPRGTIQGWRFRNTVPTPWVPVIIQMALDGGFISSIDGLKGPPIKAGRPKRKRRKPRSNDHDEAIDLFGEPLVAGTGA